VLLVLSVLGGEGVNEFFCGGILELLCVGGFLASCAVFVCSFL
jgi:hypothetical protein